MDINLQWIASLPTSAMHAADALRRGYALSDAEVAAAIAAPAEQLCRQLRRESVPEDEFWEHVAALSSDLINSRELSAIALRKVLGGSPRVAVLVDSVGADLFAIVGAMREVRPGLVDQVALEAESLQNAWEAWGRRLLTRVSELTEPGLVAAEARVIVLPPLVGGAGHAHLSYNTVRIEAITPDPRPELPEVVRLAWLVSQLQTDLPMHSETIPKGRLPALAQAAMLPPALAAAQEAGLLCEGVAWVERAAEAWHVARAGRPWHSAEHAWNPGEHAASSEFAEAVTSWWATYCERRPPWRVALSALDQMLSEPAGVR